MFLTLCKYPWINVKIKYRIFSFCFLFCLLLEPAQAEEDLSHSLALSAGLISIGSELGYVLGISAPYKDEFQAFQFQIGEMNFSGITNNQSQVQSKGYLFIEIMDLIRIFKIGNIRGFFRGGGFLAPPSALTDSTSVGLRFSVLSEYFVRSSSIALYSEVGFSFPLVAKADNFIGSPKFAQGAMIGIGVRGYLF